MTYLSAIGRSSLFLRVTAALPLVIALGMPFLPLSVQEAFHVGGHSPCDTLANGVTFASVCLLGHRILFVLIQAAPHVPTWLGLSMGAAIALVVQVAFTLTRHGVSETLVCSLGVMVTSTFSYASTRAVRQVWP